MNSYDRERVAFARPLPGHLLEIECPSCARPVLVDDLGVADQGVLCWAAGHGDSPEFGARVVVAAAESLALLASRDRTSDTSGDR